MSAPRRGRPAAGFSSPTGTRIEYRSIGLTRQRKARALALAAIPEDVFEAALASADHRVSVARVLAFAGRSDGKVERPFTTALRSALRLPPQERAALVDLLLGSLEVTP